MRPSKLSQPQPSEYFLAPCVSPSSSPVSLIDVLPKGDSDVTQQRKTKHLYYTILSLAQLPADVMQSISTAAVVNKMW